MTRRGTCGSAFTDARPDVGLPPPAAPSAAINRVGAMLVWVRRRRSVPADLGLQHTDQLMEENAGRERPHRRRATERPGPCLALARLRPDERRLFLLKLNPTEGQNDIGYWAKSLVGEIGLPVQRTRHHRRPALEPGTPRALLAQNAPNPFRQATAIPFELRTPSASS
jgi:hypothetical protein